MSDLQPGPGAGSATRFATTQLKELAKAILEVVGCPVSEAERVADCLVEADARGLESHGLLRLPLYVTAVEAGGIVPGAAMVWLREHAATSTLDAAFGFGHTAIEQAISRAGDLAAIYGCAVVGVQRSTHFGMAAPWAEGLADQGIVAILLSNTGPSVAPYGSAEALLGTNPVCVGIPVDGRPPLVLDMATSAGAFGRVVSAASRREEIPADWALDSDGRPTRDAQAALGGVLRPFGAHKGSGLAIIVELLAAALPGALLSHQITDIWIDPASRMGTGHLVIAINPSSVAGKGVFEARVREFVGRVSAATPAAGHTAIQLPGDVERERSMVAHRDGVLLTNSTAQELNALARRLGVARSADTLALGRTPRKES